MHEQLEELLATCLEGGMAEETFWDLSVAEIRRWLTAWEKREKRSIQRTARESYALATMIGAAVSKVLGGSQFPDIETFYPSLFTEDKPAEEKKEPEMDAKTAASVANIMNFARAWNRKKEAEDNACT